MTSSRGSSSSTNWRGFTTLTLPMLFPVAERAAGMASALQSLIEQACEAIEQGASLIVLSDRGVTRRDGADPLAAGVFRAAPRDGSPRPARRARAW